MKLMARRTVGLIFLFSIYSFVYADGSMQHSGNALAHSSQAVAHASVAGVKFISGAVAVPLLISGDIGKASGDMGATLWEEANQPVGTPLAITDEIFTAGPSPAQAMGQDEDE